MKLKSLNRYIGLLILIISFLPLHAEEEIDIWNKENTTNKVDKKQKKNISDKIIDSEIPGSIKVNTSIQIHNEVLENSNDVLLHGIYDPEENNFDLNMWSQTDAENVRSSINRITKINLSSTSKKLFESTLFSFAYPPKGMDENEFIDFKINWMINNQRENLIEKFLKQNNTFHNKEKVIQYLVDKNIAKANIKEGCEKINFIDKNIKDSYLEKFKIYCLIFDNKKNEAQLLYDILKEQKQSDIFFDDKINFLLGITDKTSKKIREDNLLNFYLSSITVGNFEFEPTKKTKKIIWDYLNSADLIKLKDINDKEKLKDLEIAANQEQFDKQKIFDIYKKIPFDLNTLINAENIYQTLDGIDSRALIYQKFLLSDNIENKIQLLFSLEKLFRKDDLLNVYIEFLSDRLKEINLEDIPESYQEVVQNNIISKKELKLGKIKYDDKILHQSKLIKFFTENDDKKKTQKEFIKIYKKIKKNKKYFYSGKDLALLDSLSNEGFKIPEDLNYQSLKKGYDIPENLLKLAKNNETAFLALKIVEIIGEDEPYQLDAETVYFITHLLNQTNLRKLRNEILISALPLRS
jgi:hypothetical protein